MTTAEEKAIKQAEHEQRLKELKLQKSLDKSWDISKYKIENVLVEMNIRLTQYKTQFKVFSEMFLVKQTINDFNQQLTILQTGKIDVDLPVAMLKDQTIIIIDTTSMTFR